MLLRSVLELKVGKEDKKRLRKVLAKTPIGGQSYLGARGFN